MANSDFTTISQIVVSANKFYKNIAKALVVYVLLLVGLFPFINQGDYSFLFTAALIVAISISFFSQYYFGVVDRLLLTSDQKGYVQYNAQTVTLVINTIACFFLIKAGATIQTVKLTTSIIFLFRPLYLRYYVDKHYLINRKITYEKEPISQKWNGIAQHIAAVVLNNTDTIVLTLFSSFSNVSIYSVYYLVVSGVKQLFTSLTSGIQALLGELWAKKEVDTLNTTFSWTEWTLHSGGVLLFGCTASLIVPFVRIYTFGINDANYIVPLFALLITIANGLHCLRLPYNILILAVGHYKQTQSNYIIAAILNILVSIIGVKHYGLIGVAIGTLVAMGWQTLWMAWYDSKNILNRSYLVFIKQLFVDVLVFFTSFSICQFILDSAVGDYLHWLFLALETMLIWIVVSFLVNLVFYYKHIKSLLCRKKR